MEFSQLLILLHPIVFYLLLLYYLAFPSFLLIHTFLVFITFAILCFFIIFCYCFLGSGMFTIFYSELALVSQHLFFFSFDCIHHQPLTSLCLFDFVSPIFLLVRSFFAGFHLSLVTLLSFNPVIN